VLTSSDATGNNITVVFAFHPTAGAYTVTNGSLTGAGSCLISTGVFTGTTYNLYTSTGKSGDQVNLTISGGKVTATFSNIAVADNSGAPTVTGTLVQE
jgi:hypothetical protein